MDLRQRVKEYVARNAQEIVNDAERLCMKAALNFDLATQFRVLSFFERTDRWEIITGDIYHELLDKLITCDEPAYDIVKDAERGRKAAIRIWDHKMYEITRNYIDWKFGALTIKK